MTSYNMWVEKDSLDQYNDYIEDTANLREEDVRGK